MAQGNFDPCFRFTLGEEGRYSSTPNDPGNWSGGEEGQGTLIGTCWGVSAPALIDWMGPENAHVVTPDFMRNLSVDMAKDFYNGRYWNKVLGEELPKGLDLAVWDFAVNAGVKESVGVLQGALAVKPVDGIMGPQTLGAIAKFNLPSLIDDVIAWHDYFYHHNKLFSVFGAAWLARQERLKTAALAMVS